MYNLKKIIRTEEAFDILDKSNCSGSDWGSGGCAILAQALNKLTKYPIYVIYNTKHNSAEHFGVKTEKGTFIDHDGEHKNEESWVNFFLENEMPRSGDLIVIPYNKNVNIEGIKFDNKASEELKSFIRNKMNENIRKIVREEIENVFEDFRYRYDGKFTPSDDVVSVVNKAIDIVSKNNLVNSNSSNEGSGLSKAKSISAKEPMSHSQLKRMKAFFDNNSQEVQNEKSKGNTIESSGLLQSWDLWGGDAGKRWCEKMLNQRNSSNNTSKTVRGASGIRTKTLMDPHNTRIHK